MAEPKTKVNDGSVDDFLAAVSGDNAKRAEDARTVAALMGEITGEPGKMWGSSIIGFGQYRYTYASGKTGDWMVTGLSPRKQSLTVYITDGFADYDELLQRLGKYKTGKSCLYIKKLEDVDMEVLAELIRRSVAHMNQKYGNISD